MVNPFQWRPKGQFALMASIFIGTVGGIMAGLGAVVLLFWLVSLLFS
jgi:hypothetical protein